MGNHAVKKAQKGKVEKPGEKVISKKNHEKSRFGDGN